MAYQAITTGAISGAFSPYTAGFSFTVPAGITVNALGIYNATKANFGAPKLAYLYDITSTPTLLASATWLSDPQTSRVFVGSDYFAYQPVTPVNLTTGKTYLIYGDGSSSTDQFGTGSVSYSSDITLVSTLYGNAGVLPTNNQGTPVQAASFLYGSYTLPVNPGTLQLLSANSTTVSLNVAAPMFGTGQKTTNIWRSTTPNSNGTQILSGVTPGTVVVTPSDANLAFYKALSTDTVPTTVSSNIVAAQTGKGPFNFGCVGDSLQHTSLTGTFVSWYPQIALDMWRGMAGNVFLPDIINQAQSGTYTSSWLSGGSYLAPAITAFNAGAVTDILLDLGINDARLGTVTPATFKSNLSSIITSLGSGISTLRRVHIPYTSYQTVTNGLGGGSASSGDSVNATIVSYQPQIDSLVGTTIGNVQIMDGGKNRFAVLAQNADKAYLDGLHYNDYGNQLVAGVVAQPVATNLGLISSGSGLPPSIGSPYVVGLTL